MNKSAMMAANIPEDCHEACAKAVALGLDWTTILALLAQYGPVFLEILKRLFTPTPTPTA